jgi:AraC-like DNA-binding protein
MANAVSSSFLDRRFFITNNFDFTDAENLLNEYYAKKMDYKTVVCAYAMKILTEIIRMYIPEEIAENIDGDNLYDKRFVIIENCLLYDKNITLTELADRVGVCPRQMQRLLKKYYGKSFREMKHKN